MPVRRAILWLAAALWCVSCTRCQSPARSASVRVFKTDTVEQAGGTPEGLRATVVWSAVKDLDPLEIAALADPLIDPGPPWGSYVGISQQRVESGGRVIRENHLDVSLTSLESIADLKAFCEEHYPDTIILRR